MDYFGSIFRKRKIKSTIFAVPFVKFCQFDEFGKLQIGMRVPFVMATLPCKSGESWWLGKPLENPGWNTPKLHLRLQYVLEFKATFVTRNSD